MRAGHNPLEQLYLVDMCLFKLSSRNVKATNIFHFQLNVYGYTECKFSQNLEKSAHYWKVAALKGDMQGCYNLGISQGCAFYVDGACPSQNHLASTIFQ